ncbi:MAG: glyceraldehyde 3-phosphate dehydrogenase NAD-binding domain-containing protein [Candidatus Paceibacterota bacterium]
MAKIAINGFGRIGRLFFRQAMDEPSLEVTAINDLGNLENLVYLLKHDTVYRGFPGEIKTKIKGDESYLVVDGKEIRVFQEKEPAGLPWGKLGIDIVVEATGIFESFDKAKVHLEAGAKRVVITAPAKDAEGTANGKTVLVGINDKEIKSTNLTSNGSCTTNAVAPVIAVLAKNIGISKAVLNTTHAYTATQSLVDGPVKGKDFLRGRAGAQNLIPSTTGAALTVGRVLKELDGKFDGISIRTPVVCGSLADITFLAKRKTSVEEINEVLKKAAADPEMKGILAVSEEPLVSSDIIGEENGAIVDLSFTRVIDGDLVKVLIWYENEWGYCSILIKHVLKAAEAL